MELKDKLQTLKQQKGFTLAALAKRTGLSKSFLSELHTGKKKGLKTKTLFKLALAYGVDVEELIFIK